MKQFNSIMAHRALVDSGIVKLEAVGFLLEYCTEKEVCSVSALSEAEMNALIMMVRKRSATTAGKSRFNSSIITIRTQSIKS